MQHIESVDQFTWGDVSQNPFLFLFNISQQPPTCSFPLAVIVYDFWAIWAWKITADDRRMQLLNPVEKSFMFSM